MQKLKLKIANAVTEAIKKAFGDVSDIPSPAELAGLLEYPPDDSMGDLALPCFRYSKALRKAPPMIAKALEENFSCDGVSKAQAVNGYLNFYISNGYYNALIPRINEEGADYGKSHEGDGKTVVLDYSAPNICKPFHIGHLASTVIGHSLKKLHEFSGYKCVGVNHLGDWGTQFGKQIAAYKLWGDKEKIDREGVDGLVELYVRINNEIEGDEKNGIPPKKELADRAREEFHKLEEGDPENTELWKWFVQISLDECNRTYDKLGIEFDSYAGESFYTDKMPEQVELLKEKNLLKVDNGASIVDLDAYGMPPCLILKSDGSTLYPTRDIAAAVYRKRTYDFGKCIYVTASAQCLHFAQWFKVVDLMGYDFADKLVHVPYGMVSIDGAKLATRTGNVILIRDL
ncbi:MAG: arginine--tRNA ligase, partial [Clostridiales bacterium]|nr:arginine--tRNA ligase [Clostridiales bacterium]